jgi:hypothetical protein
MTPTALCGPKIGMAFISEVDSSPSHWNGLLMLSTCRTGTWEAGAIGPGYAVTTKGTAGVASDCIKQ